MSNKRFGLMRVAPARWQNHAGGWRFVLPVWRKWSKRYDINIDDFVYAPWILAINVAFLDLGYVGAIGLDIRITAGWSRFDPKYAPPPVAVAEG